MFRQTVIASLIFVTLTAAMTDAPQKLEVGVLSNQAHVDGAGCSFRRISAPADNHDIFQWDFNDEAWINIDSRDVKLTVVASRELPIRDGEKSVGDRRLLKLSANDLIITVDTHVISVCDENDEHCETWAEQGLIKVNSGQRTSMAHVDGTCGS